jgi:asparagine synthase (glutamine-hydrolysing)
MPGLIGLLTINLKKDTAFHFGDCIFQSIQKESFYNYGIYRDITIHNNYIGFSSIKNSFSDCMPIYNEKKDIVMFLTGECYDDKEIILSLQNKGHKFEQANASYLVHRYEEMGESLFKELNGWFHGIILDHRQNKVLIFNDRYGIRRLYIYENPDFIAFASEAKALLRAFPELREVSYQSIGEFLIYDCVLQNRTYFPRIKLLPPGSVWTYQNGKLEKNSYINMTELENQPKVSIEQFNTELTDTFKHILPRYFQGGRIGLGLTGGLDTRAIIACRNPGPGELPCYTFTGSYKDILDARIAPKVAKACG